MILAAEILQDNGSNVTNSITSWYGHPVHWTLLGCYDSQRIWFLPNCMNFPVLTGFSCRMAYVCYALCCSVSKAFLAFYRPFVHYNAVSFSRAISLRHIGLSFISELVSCMVYLSARHLFGLSASLINLSPDHRAVHHENRSRTSARTFNLKPPSGSLQQHSD